MRTVSRTPMRGRTDDDTWVDPVIDKDLTAPPGSPGTGDRYIVASVATGLWATHEDDIAEWNGLAWVFTTPTIGLTCYVNDETEYYSYNGSAWVQESFGPHGPTHEKAGSDAVPVENLGTTSTTAGEVPTADGAGGLTMAAVGGGVVTLITAADDMAVILNAATSNSSFWLGDGSHVPSVPIDISGKSNISIMAGRGAVITAALSAALDPLITMHTNSGILWRDARFAITSDGAGRTVFGFDDGADSSDIKIQNCSADNSSAGFRTRFVSNALAAESITHLSITNCSLTGHWQNLLYMEIADAKTCDQLVVKDCNAVTDATTTNEAAVLLDDTTTGAITNSQVEGNYFQDFDHGVKLPGAAYTSIVDNLIIGAVTAVDGGFTAGHHVGLVEMMGLSGE